MVAVVTDLHKNNKIEHCNRKGLLKVHIYKVAKGASLIRMQNAKMICDPITENLVTKFACAVFKEMPI